MFRKKICLILMSLLLFFSCKQGINDTDFTQNEGTGSTEISMFFPDYMAKANGRVVASQTKKVKFSYYNKKTELWVNHSTIDLNEAEKQPVLEESLIVGYIYTFSFERIPTSNYAAGEFKVELLDEAGNILTEGKNAEPVGILMGETSEAKFYTVPVSAVASEGSLKIDEMKFLKKEFYVGKQYKLTVNINENVESYPDIVIFNKDGTYKEYYIVDSAEEATIDFGDVTEDTFVYIGIFADDGDTSYTLDFIEEGAIEGSENFESFNKVGFGKDGEIDSSFAKSGSPSPVMKSNVEDADEDGYAVYFDFKYLRDGESSLKRTIILNEKSLLSFSVKTDIYEQYDGFFKFYIDGEEKESFVGMNGSWIDVNCVISEGRHELEWRAEGVERNWTSGITNSVLLDNLKLSKAPESLSSFSQNFDEELDGNWSVNGLSASVIENDPIFAAWAQYGDALEDSHGKIFKLSTYNGAASGNSALKISNITTTVDSAISFDYRLDLWTSNSFTVYVDDEEKYSTTGYGEGWRKGSIYLSAGNHTVEFKADSDGYYLPSLRNAVYLDNISLVPDTTESVGIYPKGKQETFVNGNTIQFTANALRSDNSIRSDRDISWSCTGGTITQDGLFTPGSTPGTYTVTASVDGKQASNSTVIVHGENYLEDSVTINGTTFTGYSGSTTSCNTSTISFEIAPSGSSFEADGFFVLKGKVTNSATQNHAIILIKSGDYETYYLLKDEFYERIWLRFGNTNEYTVIVGDMISINFSGECYMGSRYYPSKTWTVTNTSPISTEEAVYLLPSYFCQGDNFIVSNTINAILAELPQDATVGQKLQALHDWQIHALHYDNVTLNHSNRRKLQDAVSVLKNAMAVCEGYANLYACFARAIGVKTKFQASNSMNHAWVQCYYNNGWKLVDVTWDDPVDNYSDSNTEKNPYAENYNYFLISLNGVDGDHYGDVTAPGRSAIKPTQPLRFFGPDGWY